MGHTDWDHSQKQTTLPFRRERPDPILGIGPLDTHAETSGVTLLRAVRRVEDRDLLGTYLQNSCRRNVEEEAGDS